MISEAVFPPFNMGNTVDSAAAAAAAPVSL
jgi:hypothetical protein